MDRTISQRELRNDSGSVMRRVERGESFVVTRNGTPVADLVPHRPAEVGRPPQFVPIDLIAERAAGLPDWNVASFYRDLQDLEQFVEDRDLDRWTS